MPKFSTPRGTQDILPQDWPYWDFILAHAEEVATLFGYRHIETPTFGPTTLFARTSGQETDIGKEMYTFVDRGGDDLTLRPEGTAPVVRAYLQHGMSRLPQPVKLYYVERMFRYDRPQRGRWREHHQFGCEALGVEDAYVDVEIISLLVELYGRLGLTELKLEINSIGDTTCRPAYVADLVAYLSRNIGELAPQDRERLEHNPLRVLDTKEAETHQVLESAPDILDYLCAACRGHFDKLQRGLRLLAIDYTINPRLVRGLDYYNRTVFEFLSPREGAQAAVNGGGRYDPLAEAIGGPPTPGIGFGMGVERVILALEAYGVELPELDHPTVFVAHIGEGTEDEALRQTYLLRKKGVAAVMDFGLPGLKSQLRHANAAGSRLAVIIGEDELKADSVTIKPMDGGPEQRVPKANLVPVVRRGTG